VMRFRSSLAPIVMLTLCSSNPVIRSNTMHFHADGDPNRKRRAARGERYTYTRAGAQGNLHVTKKEGPAVSALERLHGTKSVSPPANCRGAHPFRSRKAAAGTGRGADLGYDLVVLGQVGSAGATTVDAVSAEVDLEHLAHLGGFALCALSSGGVEPGHKLGAHGDQAALGQGRCSAACARTVRALPSSPSADPFAHSAPPPPPTLSFKGDC
jgi:hypothetical protein